MIETEWPVIVVHDGDDIVGVIDWRAVEAVLAAPSPDQPGLAARLAPDHDPAPRNWRELRELEQARHHALLLMTARRYGYDEALAGKPPPQP